MKRLIEHKLNIAVSKGYTEGTKCMKLHQYAFKHHELGDIIYYGIT